VGLLRVSFQRAAGVERKHARAQLVLHREDTFRVDLSLDLAF
jgi:hypothetical protein